MSVDTGDKLREASRDVVTFRQLLEGFALITDKLGQELIAKAAGPHSPIGIEDLGTFSGPRDEALERLYKFEEMGIFTSAFVPQNGGTRRVFSITELGRKMLLATPA